MFNMLRLRLTYRFPNWSWAKDLPTEAKLKMPSWGQTEAASAKDELKMS